MRCVQTVTTSVNLLKNCDNFSYENAEARHYLEQTKQSISTGWSKELAWRSRRRRCCERSAAVQGPESEFAVMDCRAALAMTNGGVQGWLKFVP